MKKLSVLILWSWLLLYAFSAHANGYMKASMGAEAQFVYVQIVQVMGGTLKLNMDVTALVPYTVQIADGGKILVIQ